MHILIAPNAFKNSLNAKDASEALGKGLQNSGLECTTECFPIGDGGDGTARIIIDRFKGADIDVEVQDPLGRRIKTSFGLIENGKTAVLEMADASGLRLLSQKELNPFITSTAGTGEMILAALDQGANKIIIGLGGSATVDGGAGLLYALGIRFLDSDGSSLKPVPQHLKDLAQIDFSGMDQRVHNCKIIVLCDVDNYLLGENGSAAVFGPQKGAKVLEIPQLDAVLAKISQLAAKKTQKQMDKVKHGGAAGGSAAALFAFCNAELVNGAEYFLELTNFEASLKKCNLLITGEGSLDEQTLQGKAPFAVAKYARENNISVIGIGGKIPLEENRNLSEYFNALISIGHEPSDLASAIENTRANLIRTGTLIGNLISLSQNK